MSLDEAGYIPSAPYDEGYLTVSSIHTLFYQQYGKKDGKPVIFLHGGPGAGTSPESTIFFNPSIYRIILLDQRGSGKSTPHAEIRENTTAHLVADIEALRTHLAIPKWHMAFGGSWGSTLALAYAQEHPSRVGSLVLRGIFCIRQRELDWSKSAEGPTALLFPDVYQTFLDYLQYLPEEERANPYKAYHRLLTEPPVDEESRKRQLAAGRAWNAFELATGSLRPSPDDMEEKMEDDEWVLAHARLEVHYFVNAGFLEEGELLRKDRLDRIRHIPTTIVQGRYDIVCPPQTAWDLHKALPESRLFFIQTAGHSAREPGTQEKLVEVCDEYGKMDLA
ncbi:Alpha/Beta hydrolase protein [Talaromyces proteolyticus]|uniref:Proline iminopeptidase n=1 Tax=Talaromyces proteolyticus TaxID=1131652 RepID=A0AAD4L1D1_9EURO|nr:Alpha/Beta hydrolase protein [Talaromyces proteolyticus]KAH8704805.1 Alpha/Beta hydrolase protein [Talaromyces proteolyticus]